MSMTNKKKEKNTMNTMNTTNTDYVRELQIFYDKDFVISDTYTVIEPGLSEFNLDQTITHKELVDYIHDNKDFKLESIIVLPELTQ